MQPSLIETDYDNHKFHFIYGIDKIQIEDYDVREKLMV